MLNLARRLRSTSFDQVVGQPLVIRVLKNSLYKNYFFPLYLFSGMRGCGKTTTARVFASAVNCNNLDKFQTDPRNNSVPCFDCKSCIASQEGNHPDIIEIDAASNTGVDNVRLIIENSTYLPLIGRKKVYIIDEAHMLSKAAFNAFLKVLEEPPTNALFILATTEHSKIIDTVKSRSLQIFFRPVLPSVMREYLLSVAKQEKITIEKEAVDIIVSHSEGSVRDALNILEQIRFVANSITKEHVTAMFGQISDLELVQFLDLLINKQLDKLSLFFKSDLWQKVLPEQFFKQILFLVRSKALAGKNQTVFIELFHYLCTQETVFLKSFEKQICLEAILLNFVLSKQSRTVNTAIADVSLVNVPKEEVKCSSDWQESIKLLESKVDPLVVSFFSQAKAELQDNKTILRLPKKLSFFQDMVWQYQNQWKPYLENYGELVFDFSLEESAVEKQAQKTVQSNFVTDSRLNSYQAKKEKVVEPEGPLSKKLVELFPGVITLDSVNK